MFNVDEVTDERANEIFFADSLTVYETGAVSNE